MKKTINTKEFIQILNKVCDDIETNKDSQIVTENVINIKRMPFCCLMNCFNRNYPY